MASVTRRRVGLGLAVAALAVIAWFTLRPGEPGTQVAEPHAFGLSGDEGLQDFVANVALFVPLGLSLVLSGWRARSATLAGGACSMLIEITQARLLPNRDATASDVLANTLGAAVGAALMVSWPRLLHPPPRLARRLALAGALLGTLVFAMTAWLTQPAEPGRWYLGQYGGSPPPARDSFSFGTLTMRANGIAIPWGAIPDPVGALSGTRATRLEFSGVITRATAEWARLAGLHEIAPHAGRQRLNVEWNGRDLRVVSRARAEALLLRSPWILLPDAAEPTPGDTLRVVVTAGTTLSVAVTQRGVTHAATLLTPLAGWMLFVPDGLTPRRGAVFLHLLWLLLLFGPTLWWSVVARRAPSPSAPNATT